MITTLMNADASAAESRSLRLRRILVAHDGSPSANVALMDAIGFGRHFDAEVLVVHIEAPAVTGIGVYGAENVIRPDLEQIKQQIMASGVRSKEIHGKGAVGETLLGLCCEESADMLMMGAYGFSDQKRASLGSTTEYLLRTAPCPVLTYGPKTAATALTRKHKGPVLFPVSLPCDTALITEGIALAALFGVSVEAFHVVTGNPIHDYRWFETKCRAISSRFREKGIQAGWSFLYGRADLDILVKCMEIDSPFILMPLKRRQGLSAPNSDNIVAHVLQLARIPVMTYWYF